MNGRTDLMFVFALILAFSFCPVDSAIAASATASINISVIIPSSANLTIGASGITFMPIDPTLQTQVPANENPVSVMARVRSHGTPNLSVLASDDLRSGADVIPVSAIRWTADSAPFFAGTLTNPYVSGSLSKSVPKETASFPTGSGTYQSAFRYFMTNSSLYLPGSYSTSIVYTLIAP